MKAFKRKKNQKERDLELITVLSLQGLSENEIADNLQQLTGAAYRLSRQQILKDLMLIRERWRQQSALEVQAERNRVLAENEALKLEFWKAWRKSQQEMTTKKIKDRRAAAQSSGELEKTLSTEGRDGDPRYLQGVERCIERYVRLLGLERPQKIAFTDPSGDHESGQMNEEEIRRRFLAVLKTVGELEGFMAAVDQPPDLSTDLSE